jgi:predicted  nucleic acid-binding Zn-ribbon protein
MTADIQSRIARLQKSTENVRNARNASQMEAAKTFLVQRARELADEQHQIEAWLDRADAYINAEVPEINADAQAEYNAQWIARLREYEDVCNAISAAWAVLVNEEAA